MTEPVLKPCPFCGSTPYVESESCGYRVVCESIECAAKGPWPTDCSEAEAIAAWNTRPTATDEAVVADAERWRALISSARFKMMGAAGFIHEKDGSVRVNPNSDYGWLHFGIEVWDNHPAGDDAQGRHGRNLLMAYVEHRRAALTAMEASNVG